MHHRTSPTQCDLHAASARPRFGFTVTELMIAVVVLIVVILGSTQIFSSAGRVASVGAAATDVLQEAAAIERQLRRDLSNVAHEGFFGIRSVSVRNDINGVGTLLNPNLPPTARIRADQLVFFVNGVESTHNFPAIGSAGLNRKPQSTTTRLYYGHGFQIPEREELSFYFGSTSGKDPAPGVGITPWSVGSANFRRLQMTGPSANIFNDLGSAGDFDISQPEARQWLLMRHPLLLLDDGGAVALHANQMLTGRTISSPEVVNGRVDGASQRLQRGPRNFLAMPSVREEVLAAGNPQAQKEFIADNYLFYPRGERRSPSMHRVDQALTNNVLSSGCSSFRIEWMYETGVGATPPANNGAHQSMGGGITPVRKRDSIWFGLPDGVVGTYTGSVSVAEAIFPQNIERTYTLAGGAIEVYEAIFGFNPDKPLYNPTTELPTRQGPLSWINAQAGYTPWPSAIRVTMTLHDPNTTLESGREVQFVVRLPQRVN